MALILACNCWSQLINEASCTAGLGLPKGRVNEDPGAVPMKQTPGSPLKCRVAVRYLTPRGCDANTEKSNDGENEIQLLELLVSELLESLESPEDEEDTLWRRFRFLR